MVQCFDLKNGKVKWKVEEANSTPEKNSMMVSRAAPSAVADKSGVIAFFEGGNIVALNHEGKPRWKRDLTKEFGTVKARHGIAASLEQDAKRIFVWVERMEDPYVLAIDKSNGETLWKSDGVGSTSWASPRLISIGETKHLVLSSLGKIAGYNPENGKQVWSFEDVSGNSSATPTQVGNGEFLIGSAGAREGGPERVPSCGVIAVTQNGDKFDVKWKWRAEKASCSFGSPITHDGRAYFVNRVGVLHCLDLETGKQVFMERLPTSIWATPLATQNGIYFFGKDGTTSVIKAGDEMKLVSENVLWKEEPKKEQPKNRFGMSSGPVLYAAAVADSKLILRRGDRLYAVGGEN